TDPRPRQPATSTSTPPHRNRTPAGTDAGPTGARLEARAGRSGAILPRVDDFELLDRWRGGDVAAGNQLLRRHFDALYRFFTNKAADQADDLIQATMMACVRGRESFRKQCSFKSFLFVVARHELYRFIKKHHRSREVFDPQLQSAADLGPSPSTALA